MAVQSCLHNANNSGLVGSLGKAWTDRRKPNKQTQDFMLQIYGRDLSVSAI